MSAQTLYHDPVEGLVDISGHLPKEGWELREDSEEGSTPTSTLPIADSASEFDFVAHRTLLVVEPDSEADDDIIVGGYTWNQKIARLEGPYFEPHARAWGLRVNDANALWNRVVMRGSDCNRPDETDVERMQWLLGTSEASILFDDVTTFFHTASPVAMDGHDYRGMKLVDVVGDCAEAGGKNWWAKWMKIDDERKRVVWYGRDTHATYDSPLYISNDPADWQDEEIADGSSIVWTAQDAKTSDDRDGSRVFCGAYGEYNNGKAATYRHNATTHAAFGHRDTVIQMPTVKTKAKAQARLDRILADANEQDDRISAVVRVPAAKGTMIRSGMRIGTKLVHIPGFTDWTWCRILNCTPTPVAAGEQYDLALELTPTGQASSGPPLPPFTGSAFAGVMLSQEYDPGDNLGYKHDGDNPPSGWYATPTIGPLRVVGSAEPFLSVEVLRDMPLVRIEANAFFTTVAEDASVQITVESSVQGTLGTASDSYVGGLDSFNGTLQVDVEVGPVVAGEIITVTGTYSGFLIGGWSDSGANTTYLRVGRGTHYWDVGGTIVWVGPS